MEKIVYYFSSLLQNFALLSVVMQNILLKTNLR